METPKEMLARIQMMADGDVGTWDLSPNDEAALKHVMAELETWKHRAEVAEEVAAHLLELINQHYPEARAWQMEGLKRNAEQRLKAKP